MDSRNDLISWLLEGDPAIRWQVKKELLHASLQEVEVERSRISSEGWGAALLDRQDPDGQWGKGLYSPKWISTTYTLLHLMRLGLNPASPGARKGCRLLLEGGFYADGGINFWRSMKHSETCVTGMVVALLSYFRIDDERLESLVDWLIGQQMNDNGWNCESFKGAHHSSFHTTISVLEGLHFFEQTSSFRKEDIRRTRSEAIDFLLVHKLYRSDHTGEVVDPRMTLFSFPPRWRYDVLRALDFLQFIRWPAGDPRLKDAVGLLKKKRRKDGTWPLQNRHKGRLFFKMEEVGKPSRWNTLRALRVLSWYSEAG